MTSEERNAELDRLNDVLTEFAQKKNRASTYHSFIFLPFDKSGTAEDAFRDYLEGLAVIVCPPGVKMEELNEENLGVLDVSECLCEWLFGVTGFTPYRQRAEELLDAMIRVSQATKIWKVGFTPGDWYEGAWDDFLFESEKQVFVLHLGVGD